MQGELRHAQLEIRLLGVVEVHHAGRRVPLPTRHVRALVALLAQRARAVPRYELASDLWPEAPERGGSWLRQALWQLRQALARAGADPGIVEADGADVRLNPLAIETDIDRFVAIAGASHDQDLMALELYRDDYVADSPLECFASRRRRLADLYEDTLARAASTAVAAGDAQAARRWAEILLARDVLREDGHVTLMAAYALDGTRAQVERAYRRLTRVLSEELGVFPHESSTVAYHDALRRVEQRFASASSRSSRWLTERPDATTATLDRSDQAPGVARSPIDVRRATGHDLATVLTAATVGWSELLRETNGAVRGPDAPATGARVDQRTPAGGLFVAEVGGRVVALAKTLEHRDQALAALYFAPEAVGLHSGEDLIRALWQQSTRRPS